MYSDRHREAQRGASSKLRDPRSATPCAPSRKARPPAPLPQSSRRGRGRGRAAVVDRLLGRHELAPHVRVPLSSTPLARHLPLPPAVIFIGDVACHGIFGVASSTTASGARLLVP